MSDKNIKQTDSNSEFAKLISDNQYTKLPKVGDVINGRVISASKAEVKIDFEGIKTGVVRGRELYNESDEYGHLKPGDMVESTVVEQENENGEMELSFRYAGQQKAWGNLKELMKTGEVLSLKITEANKGGLMVKIGNITGFLPVSQLIPEHYPRVEGGDKNKILEFLKKFIGQPLQIKVIDANEKEDKLIVSEKAAWEDVQEKAVSQFKAGEHIKGKITAVTDFGAFVEFGNKMEGLVHISELAWQRIDDPRDVVRVGQEVEAEIINIEGTKIFLSMKKLQKDPWEKVAEKYKIGEIVSGKVLKINPFGLFVELDQDIHGLAHITELSEKPITDLNEIAKINDVIKFKIITIEPKNHRLGLSLKTSKEGPAAKAATEKKPKTEKTADIKETKVEENKVEEEKPAKKPAKAKEEKEKKAKSAKKAKK